MSNFSKMVVLIDADNTPAAKVSDILREISTHGRIVVKRAYGNWKKNNLKNWEEETKRLAIKAEHQFDYVAGKNATDIALVIQAIDLLYSDIYDAFVLVSSDSDYTPLAIKLREKGVYVMGVGEQKTPEPFRNSCDEFIFLENISKNIAVEVDVDSTELLPKLTKQSRANAVQEDNDIAEVHTLLKKAYDTYQDDDGYVNVSSAGSFIKRTKPDFDCRTYGFVKLPQLLAAFPERYEVKSYRGKGTVTIIAYRCIAQKQKKNGKRYHKR